MVDPKTMRTNSTVRTSSQNRFLVRAAMLSMVPTAALMILFAFAVAIGQPFFLIYRYSPFPLVRAGTACVALLIGCAGLWLLFRHLEKESSSSRKSLAIAGLFFTALIVWTFLAPPQYVTQHVFNMQSPSHEGAFVLEARGVQSIREYVRETFYERIQNTPEQMLGRRVLSNPPGMTVLFILCRRTVERAPSFERALVNGFDLAEIDDPVQRTEFAAAMLYAMLLTAAWGCSIIPAYALSRLFFPRLPALCLAFACVFNPATVNFTPGKDPAQLLTALLLAYLWFDASLRNRWFSAALAGATFTIGLTIGLIHVWVLAILAITTLVYTLRVEGPPRRWFAISLAPFIAGLAFVGILFYTALDWNVLLAAYAVAARYREIQVPIITDPFYWTLIGLPMFLLFVGPYLWAMIAPFPAAERAQVQSNGPGQTGLCKLQPSNRRRLANIMLLTCIAVMIFTYFYGNNNETPRLWIPFIPMLLLAITLRRDLLCTRTPTARRICALLIVLQLLGTLAHWSLMDVRESEYRLSTGRMWD